MRAVSQGHQYASNMLQQMARARIEERGNYRHNIGGDEATAGCDETAVQLIERYFRK